MKNKIEKLLPVALLVAVVVFDQVTKQLVVANIPVHSVGASFFGDFLRIVLVYNTGVAFSIGQGADQLLADDGVPIPQDDPLAWPTRFKPLQMTGCGVAVKNHYLVIPVKELRP